MIKKIIMESLNGICAGKCNLDREYTEEEIRQAFANEKLPILSMNVDIMGTAIVRIYRNLF